jgi:putative molybdenum carrier protein
MRLVKILSGGQTGIDRGTLGAILAWSFPCGDWCPPGRLAENGQFQSVIPLSSSHSAPTLSRGSTSVLDTWTTCNANLAGGHHQELAALEIVSVLREHGIEVFDLGLKLSSWEPKENDAGVG